MDMEFRYLDISAVTKGRIDWSATQLWKYADAPSRARRRLHSGDILLCTVRPGLQAHARICQEEDTSLVGSTGFAVLRPNLAGDSGFVFHQIFGDLVAAQLRALETGSSYPAVNEDDVRRVRVFCPKKEERWRIAAVLDKVDEAIAKTEAVIAKLRQVRAGMLHDLLTRGLHQNGQLRDPIAHPEQFQDSPLGCIPREWTVRTCQSLCREIVVGIVVKPAQYYVEEGVPVLRSANVREDGIQLSDLVFISSESNIQLSKSMLHTDDVVMVRTGYPGTTCVVPRHLDGANCVDLIISRPGSEIAPRFLALWINSTFGKDQVLRVQGGLAQQHFNVGEMKTLLVAKPQPDEQKAIVEQIDALDSDIQAATAEQAKLIVLKSGLMTDLLTGRVRVPETIPIG
jgi:type I restriction enzyme S subunit